MLQPCNIIWIHCKLVLANIHFKIGGLMKLLYYYAQIKWVIVINNYCHLIPCFYTVVSSFKIQNKLVGKCLQVQDGMWGGRVSLRDCTSDSTMQEWLWLSGGQALTSQHTGECLTAPEEQYEGVHLQPCMVKTGNDDNEDRDMDGEESNQAWSCSKKGHLTLAGRGLHLGASPLSTLIFLSRDHKQVFEVFLNWVYVKFFFFLH